MSLDAYLRGLGPPLPPDPWRVEHRHAEGGVWTTVAEAASEAGAQEELLSDPARSSVGDLLRRVSPCGKAGPVWVVTPRGPVDPGPVQPCLQPYGDDWLAAWESEATPPSALFQTLWAAQGDDPSRRRLRPRLVAAACDLADRMAPYLAVPHEARQQAIEAARQWAREGRPDRPKAAAVQQALTVLGRQPLERTSLLANAVEAATYAAKAVRGKDPAALLYAAHQAVMASSPDRDPELRVHATLVRRHVPLSVLLLAWVGEPTPWSLGF